MTKTVLKWSERYNCHSARLAKGLEVGIAWDGVTPKEQQDGKHWKASVFGNSIGRFESFEIAEAAVISTAETLLETALNKLIDAQMESKR